MVATFAYCVKNSVFRSFHGMQDPPPHGQWYQDYLAFYNSWGHKLCTERVQRVLTEFYEANPTALDGFHHMKPGGASRLSDGVVPVDPGSPPP